MNRRIYNRQKRMTRDEVWEKAKDKALLNNQHLTEEEFVDIVIDRIKDSCIDISEDYVPTYIDKSRDEIYYSENKKQLIGRREDRIWFNTKTDESLVRGRLSAILESLNVNLGLLDSSSNSTGTRYEIKIPFISEDERQKNIREDTVKFASEIREYKNVNESDITGVCPNEDCDGMSYRSGMGSCGPKYKCTRFDCNFQFVKDVL